VTHCTRGCTRARQHVSDCPDEECRGCLPREAEYGLLCFPCHSRLRNLLRALAVQHDLLLATAGKSNEQVLTVETIAKTHQPPRTSSDGKFPAPYARTTTIAMSQSEPVRLAALDAAQELADWLSQVVEMVVQTHDLRGPRRLTTKADPRQWKWHPISDDGGVSDYDPIVTHRDEREVMRGQYILTDPPACFEVHTAADFLLAWLDRFEAMEVVGDEMEAFGKVMSQAHALAPWREQATRLPGIPCPGCQRLSLMRFGGDEDVQCTTPYCREVITPGRYLIWTRMLADEHRERA